MNTATKNAKVTISTPGGPEVETTVGELGSLRDRLHDADRLTSPLGITTQLSSKDDFLTAIRNASREIAIAKQAWKTAKELEAEEVEQLDEWLDAESATEAARAAREKLKTAKLSSEAVQDAADRTADKKAVVDLQRQIRSDLLVIYAAKFNRRTAEAIEPGENRRIILSAKVGKVEPEQLGLF
jgi:hypothetical protein